jgi:hypothetical protein
VFNQFTETFSVNDLAERAASLRGCEPDYNSAAHIQSKTFSCAGNVMRYRNRIDSSKFVRSVQWV